MAKKSKKNKEIKGLTHLGSSKTIYKTDYDPSILEAFDTPFPKPHQWVTLHCPEFTSLCPLTGQPDFAKITINYIPGKKMVESKALKLYLFSFRNHGDFHEKCIETICQDLKKLIKPNYLEVIGSFTPRGGIAIHPFSQTASSSAYFQKILSERKKDYAPGKYC